MKAYKEEKGAFSIDAIFGITFFMIAIIALMFMSLIIRVQSNIQYALGQTAKEISGYYYLIDKVGLAGATAGSNRTTTADETIGYVLDFSDSSSKVMNDVSTFNFDPKDQQLMEDIKNAQGNIDVTWQCFENMKTSFNTIASDPKQQIRDVLSVFSKTAANQMMGYLVAPLVCKAIFPKYLAGASSSSLNDYYEAAGIENADFTGSQLLTDKRSIKIVINYDLNVEQYTLGVVKQKLHFQQVATTAAWIRPDGTNTYGLNKISEALNDEPEETT